ncbi:lysine biosynthesis protein LysW [candidate division KSB1 bacterium]|nr:lysine biosynthesis protein LysW [candidate division KSB1 bacterium]
MVECVECGANIELDDDSILGDLIICEECGCEMEVTGVDPFTVAEAPQEDEDWDDI